MAKTSKRSRSDVTDEPNSQDIVTKRSRSEVTDEQNSTKRSRSKAASSNQKKKKKQKVVMDTKKAGPKSSRKGKAVLVQEPGAEEIDYLEVDDSDLDCVDEFDESMLPAKRVVRRADENGENEGKFVGEPIDHEEALRRWPNRYVKKNVDQASSSKGPARNDDSDEPVCALKHYLQAEVDGQIYNLNDDAYVKAEDDMPNYICKITEIFLGEDNLNYFTARWYYRADDTVIKNCNELIDAKRIFFSEITNDNPLGCLIQKLNINRLSPGMDPEVAERLKTGCDYYCDMQYILPYCSFVSLPSETVEMDNQSDSTISSENDVPAPAQDVIISPRDDNSELTLLDLYSGCGAMSTGLSLGANCGGVRLTAKWAVDFNEFACQSLKLNHPETMARHEAAVNFLLLLKLWESLCVALSLFESSVPPHPFFNNLTMEEEEEDSSDADEDISVDDKSEIFEVEDILDVRYGDGISTKQTGLYFKIRWKGYGKEFDTWEPIVGLSDCPKKLKEFVTRGFENMILPLPGRVDVICGGPPCQGISGYNRFRNKEKPLDDEKNKQLLVYMDIIRYLKPRFVLMENVVDILKFSNGYLARYAYGSLVSMNYQARLGMMAAGSYGVPQFRMRVFLWGALTQEKLPGYPLPTHKAKNRGVAPKEFEANIVSHEQVANAELKQDLILRDAISDLPEVPNNEEREEMPYVNDPNTDFQRFIRLRRGEMPGSLPHDMLPEEHLLYDHQPYHMSDDDFERSLQIPKTKGANFRNLSGVMVGPNNKVQWDPAIKRVKLSSGKPLVPDYAMTFVKGTSTKPFGRLWHDETVSTVMTRPEPHNHALLHPSQDRVVTIRENARLQGFPDYYKLCGPIKERYIQVGNAVAVPVACALGYSLALTLRGLASNEPVFRLPPEYPFFTAEGSGDEP